MTLYLLDTNTVSYILKGKSEAARTRLQRVGTHKDQDAAVSTVTVAEILYGLEKIGAGHERHRALDLFLSEITICPWDRAAAEVFGQLKARQEVRGKPLGPYDLQIAAHAISLGAVLVSHDRAFRHITGLAGLEDWATDI